MHQRPTVRVNALERLVKVDAQSALRAARLALGDMHPDARCAAVRVIAVVGDESDAPVLAHAAEDVDASVRVAAVAALGHLGDESIQADLASDIARLAHAPAAHDRKLAARMLGSSVASSRVDRQLLLGLLADPVDDVVVEALAALHWPSDARAYADLRGLLHRAPTASAAAAALTRAGDAALPLVDEWLGDPGVGRRAHSRLARVCRTIGGQAATHVLHRHLDHLDRAVGLEVMTALAALESSKTANDRATTAAESEGDVARADLEYSIDTLRALLMFDDEASAGPLRSALRDELDLARQRVLASLAIRYGTDDINRVSLQLAQPDPRTQALALEWLEVTLHGSARAAVALVQPDVTDRDRLRALERRITVEPMSRHDVMTDLLNDHAGRWRQPWLVACALYAAAGMDPDAVTGIDPGASPSSGTEGRAGAGAGEQHDIIHETRAAIAERDVRRADR
jgi:HEAT repeat protein